MKPILWSEAFEQSLDEVADWSVDRFGPRQAARYRDLILDRIDALARGEVPHRSARTSIAPGLASDLRFISVGQHFVFFRETPIALRLLALLHQSADLSRRLDLPPLEKDRP